MGSSTWSLESHTQTTPLLDNGGPANWDAGNHDDRASSGNSKSPTVASVASVASRHFKKAHFSHMQIPGRQNQYRKGYNAADTSAGVREAVEKIQTHFNEAKAEWDKTSKPAALRKSLIKVLRHRTVFVNRAVCLGIGSFELETITDDILARAPLRAGKITCWTKRHVGAYRRRVRQLILFEATLEILRKPLTSTSSSCTITDH